MPLPVGLADQSEGGYVHVCVHQLLHENQGATAGGYARSRTAGPHARRRPTFQLRRVRRQNGGNHTAAAQAVSAPLGNVSSLAARAATCALSRSSSSLSEAVWLAGASGWTALRAPGGAMPAPPPPTRP